MNKFNVGSIFYETKDFHSALVKLIHKDPFEFLECCRNELKDSIKMQIEINKFVKRKYINDKYKENFRIEKQNEHVTISYCLIKYMCLTITYLDSVFRFEKFRNNEEEYVLYINDEFKKRINRSHIISFVDGLSNFIISFASSNDIDNDSIPKCAKLYSLLLRFKKKFENRGEFFDFYSYICYGNNLNLSKDDVYGSDNLNGETLRLIYITFNCYYYLIKERMYSDLNKYICSEMILVQFHTFLNKFKVYEYDYNDYQHILLYINHCILKTVERFYAPFFFNERLNQIKQDQFYNVYIVPLLEYGIVFEKVLSNVLDDASIYIPIIKRFYGLIEKAIYHYYEYMEKLKVLEENKALNIDCEALAKFSLATINKLFTSRDVRVFCEFYVYNLRFWLSLSKIEKSVSKEPVKMKPISNFSTYFKWYFESLINDESTFELYRIYTFLMREKDNEVNGNNVLDYHEIERNYIQMFREIEYVVFECFYTRLDLSGENLLKFKRSKIMMLTNNDDMNIYKKIFLYGLYLSKHSIEKQIINEMFNHVKNPDLLISESATNTLLNKLDPMIENAINKIYGLLNFFFGKSTSQVPSNGIYLIPDLINMQIKYDFESGNSINIQTYLEYIKQYCTKELGNRSEDRTESYLFVVYNKVFESSYFLLEKYLMFNKSKSVLLHELFDFILHLDYIDQNNLRLVDSFCIFLKNSMSLLISYNIIITTSIQNEINNKIEEFLQFKNLHLDSIMSIFFVVYHTKNIYLDSYDDVMQKLVDMVQIQEEEKSRDVCVLLSYFQQHNMLELIVYNTSNNISKRIFDLVKDVFIDFSFNTEIRSTALSILYNINNALLRSNKERLHFLYNCKSYVVGNDTILNQYNSYNLVN